RAGGAAWLPGALRPGQPLAPGRGARVRRAIRDGASPRHVPSVVLQVGGLPRTRSGKPLVVAVAKLVNGGQVQNAEVVANPEALHEIAAKAAAVRERSAGRAR